MKNFLFAIGLGAAFSLNAQTREIHSGASLSNLYWLDGSSLNSGVYRPGAQIGILKGPKEKTGLFKKKNRAFYPFFGLEYSYFQHHTVEGVMSDYHAMKAYASLRYNFLRSKESFNALFIVAEPGASVLFFQKDQINPDRAIVRADPFDLFVQAGLGTQIGFKRKLPKKDKFQCTGMTISATNYFSISPFSVRQLPSTKLNQVRLNVGLHYAFVQAKKGKTIFRDKEVML